MIVPLPPQIRHGNSIEPESKESILPIINRIMSDTLEILTVCKRDNYSVSEDEKRDIQQKSSIIKTNKNRFLPR